MEVINAIASVLKVSENQIKSWEEWASVYFVRFTVGRPKFVSKAKVDKLLPLTWVLTVAKRQYKTWVARLTGLDQKWGFTRQFLEAETIEWNRKGAVRQQFTITEPGFYQDSEGDYFEILYLEGKLEFTRYLSRDEIKAKITTKFYFPSHA